jgi:hypothetical protein
VFSSRIVIVESCESPIEKLLIYVEKMLFDQEKFWFDFYGESSKF